LAAAATASDAALSPTAGYAGACKWQQPNSSLNHSGSHCMFSGQTCTMPMLSAVRSMLG
jgi:hypothetical protein